MNIINNNQTGTINSFVTLGFPTGWHPGVYYGDFNGDGKNDILSYTETGVWAVNLSTGSGYSWPHAVAPPLQDFRGNFASSYSEPIIIDLNGDGKDDIVQFCKRGSDYCIEIYFTKNFYNNQLYYQGISATNPNLTDISPSKYSFGDFNGDGIMDIMYKQQNNSNPIIFYMFENEQFDLAQKVTDGMGVETEWVYKTLSSPTVGYASQHRKKVNWGVVESMKYSNGIGTAKNTITYSFGLPNYDFSRRQFLGFEGITITHNGESTYYDYDENTNFKHLYLYQTLKYRGSQSNLISEELNHYVFHDFGNKRFLPYKYGSTTINQLTGATVRDKTRLRSDGRVDSLIVEYYDVPFGGTPVTTEATKYAYITGTAVNGASVLKPYTVTTISKMRGSSEYLTKTTAYSYSTQARLSSVRETSASDGYIETSYTNYNTLGIPLTKTTSGGGVSRTESYQYDNTGRFRTQHRNALNQVSYYTYDAKTGNLLSEKEVNGLTTTYKYNTLGNLIATYYPNGTKDSLEIKWADAYYAAPRIPNTKYLIQKTSTGKSPVRYYYDLRGRELAKEENDVFLDTRYNALGEVTQVSLPYSTVATTDANKKWIRYTYDVYGRIKTEISDYKNITYTYTPGQETERDNIREVSYVRNYDVAGRLVSSTDPGGTILYGYKIVRIDNKVRTETSITMNGSTTKYVNDSRGNRIRLIDPDAGTITNTYNMFNEVLTSVDANGVITTCSYDALGRLASRNFNKNGANTMYTYQYDRSSSTNNGVGKLATISANTVLEESYEYDALGRLAKKTKNIGTRSFVHTYSYNSNGLINEIGYPDQFAIKHTYTSGRLSEIRRADNNALIYKVHGRNVFKKTTKCSYGNNIARTYTYDANGLLTRIKTGNKISGIIIEKPQLSSPAYSVGAGFEEYFDVNNAYQQLDYTYNNRGIMSGRTNANNSQTETFSYDNLDRLTGFTVNGGTTKSIGYSASGNITSYSNVGSYTNGSGNTLPHAVKKIVFNTTGSEGLSTGSSCVTYDAMNRPATITSGVHTYQLFYGHDYKRVMSTTRKNGTLENTRYYVSDLYEERVTGTVTHYLNYIYGENGVVAILDKTSASSSGDMYYVHTDHLGSYSFLTNPNKETVMSCHFDPWGNRMQYGDWSKKDTLDYTVINRGFTGHEHLDQFNIINMNARLYDPAIGRFFSPDPYVVDPGSTQGYNRYSYCLNNPLMHTDPDGELLIKFLINGFKGMKRGDGFWKSGAKAVWNGIKITVGLFSSDKNKNFWGKTWELVSRFTWQLPQTIVGYGNAQSHNTFALRGGVEWVKYKYGTTVLKTRGDWGAVTLSNYIVGDKDIDVTNDNGLFQHEYGHYIQSQRFGFFYLSKVGIPSALSNQERHNDNPVEQDANIRAFKYFNKHVENYTTWDHDNYWIHGYNPTNGYDDSSNQEALKAGIRLNWYDYVMRRFNFSLILVIPGLINTNKYND